MSAAIERSLWRRLKMHPRLFIANVGLSLVAAIAESAGIGLLGPVLRRLVGSEEQAAVPFIETFVEDGSGSPSAQLIRASGLVMLAVAVRCAAGFGASVAATALQTAVAHDVRMALHLQMLTVHSSFFTTSRAGSLINIVTTELYRVELLVGAVSGAVLALALAGGYATLLVAVSPLLAVLAIAVSASTLGLLSIVTKRVRAAGRGRSAAVDEMIASYAETVAASRTIRLFAMERIESERFLEMSKQTLHRTRQEVNRQAAVSPINQLVSTFAMMVLILIGYTQLVATGRLAGTTLLIFFFGLYRMAPAFQQLSALLAAYSANRVGLERIESLLTTHPQLNGSGALTVPPLRDAIELERVEFAYDDDRPVLRSVSIRIAKGRTTALVGRSGSGKSTIADLIATLIQPSSGVVRWDGIDLSTVDRLSLRKRIGVVSQDTFMFHATVRENVTYGRPTADDAEVWEALAQAGAADFVNEMPFGLQTVIGERGVSVSGGQRQRLAIARALVVRPDVLIFDEATSALDPATEREVQSTLRRLGHERTVILIAHQITTVQHADTIIVLEKGEVVDAGTYDDLRRSSASFARVQGLPPTKGPATRQVPKTPSGRDHFTEKFGES